MKLRRSAIVLLVLIGLLGVSNVAIAEHEESHPEDTWFNFGYDPADHFLAINIDPNDLDECDFQSRLLHGTYSDEVEGVYEVELETPYDICLVEGVVVAGPNGQVNHGQFMKAAKSLLGVEGHGCLVRELAKSDIGRTDDTKVRTSDVVPIDMGDDGDFLFASFEVDCAKGNNDNAEKGRPDSPGKSADAPGRGR